MLPAVADTLIEVLGNRKLILFFGEPGAGKTTFIKVLCKRLGVVEDTSSPTFAILQVYDAPSGEICHCDLYRLRSIEELQDIGFADQMEKAAFVFIEWPELALPILEAFPHVNVYLTLTDANKRNIILEA